MSITAMKQALEALEEVKSWKSPTRWDGCFDEEITSLRQAIEQAEKHEPVAVWELFADGWDSIADPEWMESLPVGTKLYTTPQPQREWVVLTDEELEKVFPAIATYHESNKTLYRSIARAIEAKLKELNT